MKYEWLDAFLLALPGVEQDFKLEWGWERDMIRDRHTRLIAKSIPGSVLSILPGDHFIARRNWQAFNPVILKFLES